MRSPVETTREGGTLAACRQSWRHLILAIGVAAGLSHQFGCVASSPTSLESEDPQARTRAIVQAAERDDRGAIPDLIGLLASDDPAERMLAIRTLKRMTGQTLGYDFAAEPWQRDEAIQRWVVWWGSNGDGGSSIAGDGPTG